MDFPVEWVQIDWGKIHLSTQFSVWHIWKKILFNSKVLFFYPKGEIKLCHYSYHTSIFKESLWRVILWAGRISSCSQTCNIPEEWRRFLYDSLMTFKSSISGSRDNIPLQHVLDDIISSWQALLLNLICFCRSLNLSGCTVRKLSRERELKQYLVACWLCIMTTVQKKKT